MDGLRLLAARFLCGLLTARPSCPPRAVDSNVGGGDPARPEARAANRRARGKRLRGAVPSLPDRDFTGGSEGRPRSGFVETVKLSKPRARPGRSAPAPTACPQAGKSHAGEEASPDASPLFIVPEPTAAYLDPMSMRWTPDSWRQKPVVQMPTDYPDMAALGRVEDELRALPPLVFAGEARRLTAKLAQV